MQSKIETQVMAGVGTIYMARTLTSITALKVYVLVLSVWMIGRLVWVAKIFQNFLLVEKSGLGAIRIYLFDSVVHTHLAVQLTLLVATVAFISLLVDAVRSVTTTRTLAL